MSKVIDIRTKKVLQPDDRRLVINALEGKIHAKTPDPAVQRSLESIRQRTERINTLMRELKRGEHEIATGNLNAATKHHVSCLCDVCKSSRQ